MASVQFVQSVIAEMARILGSVADIERLGLARDIVYGWRGYFDENDKDRMTTLVSTVARDNKISLDQYEGDESIPSSARARAAGEMILLAVDSYYRLTVTEHN